MWRKSNLHDWNHQVAKLPRPLPQRDRVRLADTLSEGAWFAHSHTKHISTADQGLFGPSDHARKRQSILQDHVL